MITTLLLIRHGQTDWNVDGRYTGQSDIPLNNVGRAQARQLAAQISPQPPDKIVASDLQRARETAVIMAAPLNLPVATDPRLREINQGVWEGMYFSDIKARYAAEFAARAADPLMVAPPGGETVGQVRHRVLAAIADIVQAYPNQRIAVVAHGLVLALIKAQATHYPITKVWDLIPPNAQVEEVAVTDGFISP